MLEDIKKLEISQFFPVFFIFQKPETLMKKHLVTT
jgi:hypothetical protein